MHVVQFGHLNTTISKGLVRYTPEYVCTFVSSLEKVTAFSKTSEVETINDWVEVVLSKEQDSHEGNEEVI